MSITGLKLVSKRKKRKKGKMASAPDARPENVKIERNGYVAEVIVSESRLIGGHIYHYVIQREGQLEILHGGQEVSMQRALECINEFMDKRISRPA